MNGGDLFFKTINEQIYKSFVIMHNKVPNFVTLNEVKGLFKIPRYARNDKLLVHFSDLLIYSFIEC